MDTIVHLLNCLPVDICIKLIEYIFYINLISNIDLKKLGIDMSSNILHINQVLKDNNCVLCGPMILDCYMNFPCDKNVVILSLNKDIRDKFFESYKVMRNNEAHTVHATLPKSIESVDYYSFKNNNSCIVICDDVNAGLNIFNIEIFRICYDSNDLYLSENIVKSILSGKIYIDQVFSNLYEQLKDILSKNDYRVDKLYVSRPWIDINSYPAALKHLFDKYKHQLIRGKYKTIVVDFCKSIGMSDDRWKDYKEINLWTCDYKRTIAFILYELCRYSKCKDMYNTKLKFFLHKKNFNEHKSIQVLAFIVHQIHLTMFMLKKCMDRRFILI